MAINIIRKGNIKRETCAKCGCYFSYEPEDTTIHNTFGVLTSSVVYTTIDCPQCGKEIILERTK